MAEETKLKGYRCPHCNKVPYPVKNEDGTINWKNLFRVDWLTFFLVAGIIMLLIGVNQINQQCYELVKDPCSATAKLNCFEMDLFKEGINESGFGTEAIILPANSG